jgi:hypothetical protein
MKSTIFWDITPCSPLKVKQCLGGIFASIFMVEGQTKEETRMKFTCYLIHAGFLFGLFFDPEDGGDT